MNSNSNPNYMHEQQDEISLQELFMALWRQKILIMVITLMAGLATGIFSVFAITPVYHTKLNIVMNMPEIYSTKYGDYTLPLSTNEQYINLISSNNILRDTIVDMGFDSEEVSIEALRERISIVGTDSKNSVHNSFNIVIAADNPSEAKKLAQTLYDNYIEFLDILTIEGALDYYANSFNVFLASSRVSLKSTQEILAKNEALLAQTLQTIIQKDAMDEIDNSDNINDYIILENIINPNYTKIEQDIIVNKQSINDIENSMRVYKEYLVELDAIRDKVAQYKVNGDYEGLASDLVSITKTNVYLASAPIEPSQKTSPSNAKNVIIGALLGGIVAVLIALIKEYWFKPEKK